MTPSPPPDPLIIGLMQPAAYPHPTGVIERMETHISWLFLAGDYAYKVKKPVTLPFLNFASMDARLGYCEDELRLNRRFAPSLYLDLVPITGTRRQPRVAGAGGAVEYAVRMRRFPQEALASNRLARARLPATQIADLGADLADFHAALPRYPGEIGFGEPQQVLQQALANFDELGRIAQDGERQSALQAQREWTESEFVRCYGVIRARHERA